MRWKGIIVDIVITEDSDAIPYGCKHIIYKLDNQGHGMEIKIQNVFGGTVAIDYDENKENVNGLGVLPDTKESNENDRNINARDVTNNASLAYSSSHISNYDYDFTHWTMDQFILFCCLSGCDYVLPTYKPKNIGIKTAYRLVSKNKTIKLVINALLASSAGSRSITASNTAPMYSNTIKSIEPQILAFATEVPYQ